MMLSYLFLLCISIFTNAAEIDYDFMRMLEHIEKCSIDCNNSTCVQKLEEIPHYQYKRVYKDVYGTYHCLSEIPARQHGLDQNFRYFINYFGEIVLCKKNATAKNELMVFKCFANGRRRHHDLFRSHEGKKLCDMSPPVFKSVRATDSSEQYHKKDDEELHIELLCCARECPTEVVGLVYDKIIQMGEKPLYLYYFFDTKELEHQQKKKNLFCMIDFTNPGVLKKFESFHKECDEHKTIAFKSDKFPCLDHDYFLVDNTFTIESLRTNVDMYGNGNNRTVLFYAQEKRNGFWHQSQKQISMMHVPRRDCELTCNSKCCGDEKRFFVRDYTIEDIKNHHKALAQAETGVFDARPFHCRHAHGITGLEKELRDYFAVALKRIKLGTSCLAKNEAATSDAGVVYNNPFGEFVVHSDGKYRIVPGYINQSNLYYGVHTNEDVLNDEKMRQRAQHFAQRWKITYDGRFLYCWEASHQGTLGHA